MEPKPASLWIVTFDLVEGQIYQGKPRERIATEAHSAGRAIEFAAKKWPDRKIVGVEFAGDVWAA